MDENRLDGNAAAGVLGEIFPFEMTLAQTACVRCGSISQVGALTVYMHEMGTVLRCVGCENVLIRVVHGPGRYWLDLRGVKYLQIEEAR